ncbi:MAG: glycosyltransferase family 4 protein, partial [Pseudomonadota bacterium]
SSQTRGTGQKRKPDKLRITFLLKDLASNGGGNRVIGQHAQYLIDAGHTVTLIGLPEPRLKLRSRLRLLRNGRLRASIEPYRARVEKISDHFKSLVGYLEVLPDHRPIKESDIPASDAIIATWWETAEWMGNFTGQNGNCIHFAQDYEVFPYLPQERVLSVYDRKFPTIAVSGWVKKQLEENHSNPHVTVVNNTVDTDFFAPKSRDYASRFTVGTLLAPSPRKRSFFALDVLRQIHNLGIDIGFVAFGQDKHSFEIPEWVKFFENPKQTQIPEIFSSCDVWLFTSESEGFGLPILEAMACGTPVLATEAGAAIDLIDGMNGKILSYDAKEFVREVIKLHESSDKLHAFSASARRTAKQKSTISSSKEFENALLQMCGSITTRSFLSESPESSSTRRSSK